jgi:thioredoxin domain-containing protein 5
VQAEDDEHGSNVMPYNAEFFASEIPKLPHIVMFYAPWCGHCKRLAPTFDQLAEKYNIEDNKANVVVAKVDCTQESPLCKEHGIQGYPTIKFFHKEMKGVKHSGARDLETLKKFVETRLEAGPPSEEEAAPPKKEEPKKEEVKMPEGESKVLELNVDNWDKTIERGYYFVKFYAPWCGHCKRLAPHWETFAAEVTPEDNYKVAKVDCTSNKDICSRYDVKGYPTLIMFANGDKNTYNGKREKDLFKSFARAVISVMKDNARSKHEKIPIGDELKEEEPSKAEEPAAEEGPVLDLSEANFDASIAEGVTFVKFFAPWCGHCKRLAPTWDELAGKYADNENVKIAKVDCTVERTLCSTHSIRGFPTLILFQNGAKVKDHSGGRDLESLSNFINSNIAHDEL